MSLSIVAVPVYIFVCFISASNLHVYSEVGPAIEVIKWHEKPDYFFGVDAEAVPSSVLLRCTSEAPLCLREDGVEVQGVC